MIRGKRAARTRAGEADPTDRRVRVAVLGATGRMGRLVTGEVEADPTLRLVATVARGATPIGPGCFRDADVVVDFSLPEAIDQALPHLGGKALVTGTTGLDDARRARVAAHAAHGALLQAANFCLGVNVLLDLVRRAAAALPEADLEIVETHHRLKRDAPSGTALALARAAREGRQAELPLRHGREGAVGVRPPGEIGMHALRGGDGVGEHTVWFLADGERLAFTHQASSRSTFARGAVRAAAWLAGRPPGTYTLDRVLGLV